MGTNRVIWERMRAIAGWVARLSVFAVLGYAGLMKINHPYPTTDFLDTMIHVRSVPLVQAIGGAEVLLALLVISGAATLWAGRMVIAAFTAFAVTHAMAAAQPEPALACGCMGTTDTAATLPTWAWIAGNAGFALIGGVIASDGGGKQQPHDAPAPEVADA